MHCTKQRADAWIECGAWIGLRTFFARRDKWRCLHILSSIHSRGALVGPGRNSWWLQRGQLEGCRHVPSQAWHCAECHSRLLLLKSHRSYRSQSLLWEKTGRAVCSEAACVPSSSGHFKVALSGSILSALFVLTRVGSST